MQLPENAEFFFSFLFPIAAFDILETDGFWGAILNVEPPDGLSPNFEGVGFETTLFLNNLGTMFFIILFFPLLMLLAVILDRFHKYQQVRLFSKSIKELVYWSGTLRIIIESYTILAICAFINFTDLQWDTYGNITMSITAIVAMIFCTLFPFLVVFFLYRNWELIKDGDEEFE